MFSSREQKRKNTIIKWKWWLQEMETKQDNKYPKDDGMENEYKEHNWKELWKE